ncbi:YbcC family protein [Pseudoponticoccus marisrubri]|uniref:YbcC family protein n=1 Tax=Pseudoponticoccus marisrubri TaxID=1685382 RepID=UPI0009FF642A|nr:DUF2309 domain-containing protein [Pseudoponticoccus marisrubri]
MFIQHQDFSPDLLTLIGAAEAAARRVAPLFPLNRAVAVNPFHGVQDTPIAQTAARMERAAGIRIFPDRAGWEARLEAGEITRADLQAARAEIAPEDGPAPEALIEALALTPPPALPIPTMAELAAGVSGRDWPGLVTERIGAWAQGHFDEGQALWGATGPQQGAWSAWRDWALRDLTPEIHGLEGFSSMVAAARQDHWRALGDACVALGIDHAAAPSVFHRLLCELGGWAGLGRYRLWEAELGEARDTTLTELLTIRLVWEQALHARHAEAVESGWQAALEAHRSPVTPRADHLVDAIWLRAAEIATARQLDARLHAATPAPAEPVPCEAQMVFCIDVRSERLRRAIESVAPGIRTHGAAGFFGLPLQHCGLTPEDREARSPVILTPPLAAETRHEDAAHRRIQGRLGRAVARFSRAAVSSFAFVEAAGPLRLGPLLGASLSRRQPEHAPGPQPVLALAPDSPAALDAAEGALRAMGLTGAFAPVVIFVGHAARVTNDAQAGLVQCGACGGHDGAVNARVLAGLLNEAPIRAGLRARGLEIPEATVFRAGLHDTTADRVTLFEADTIGPRADQPLTRIRAALEAACEITRTERALLFPQDGNLATRGADWSQTRPEWGLAGCHWFIAAPRARTRGVALDGRAFLHDYDASEDPEGRWLTDILSGPVLVAAWINLQYFGARVAPQAFGGGNKLVQNVMGGIGVLDGITGTLRGGPSDQSLGLGARKMHEPLRLAVRIAAPQALIETALEASPGLHDLVANGWIEIRPLDAE